VPALFIMATLTSGTSSAAAQLPSASPSGSPGSPVPNATPEFQPAPPPRYQYLPDEENWKICLPAKRSNDVQDALKCISLSGDRNQYLTVGADVRFKYEHFFNKDFDPSNSGYLLERELLDADLHEDRFRAFFQLEHATATDQHAPIDATWRDDFATTSAYLEYEIGGATGAATPPLAVRIGRQLLAYGSERMIDDRSGLNAEMPFDGVRARIESGSWRTDVFAVRPVGTGSFGFDDLADKTKALLGVYATDRIGSQTIDLYTFEDQRQSQFYYRGTGPEERFTFGARYATSSAAFDSDTELDKQLGSFGGATIDAYAIETNLGYDFGRNRNRFRLGVGGGIASGDHDPKSSLFTLFRAPYPTGLTFGIIEANGNENTSGFTPNLSYTYAKKVTLAVKDYFFYRQSAADGVYSAPGYPLRAPEGATAAPLGNLGYVSVVDALDRHVSIYGAYARYLIGSFFDQAPESKVLPSQSTAYYNLWFDYKI
jgi:hypothetical protein